MRQFKILKWPDGVLPIPNIYIAHNLLKELYDYSRSEPVYVLSVDGRKMYFYPDEVKEVTNEGD